MKNISLFDRVTFLDKLLFTKHLSVMVKSGIPLSEAIGVMETQTKKPIFKAILRDISNEVTSGQTLKKALSKYPKIFDPIYLNLISIGEESGNLEENLEYLADELQESYEFNKKVKSAMLYPEIILSVALVMGGGISIFVLPQLANLFSSLDTALPLSTRVLLWLSTTMQSYGLIIVPAVFGVVFLFSLLVMTPKLKPLWQKFLLGLPIFGPFIRDSQTASICRNLGLMLKSGLPIVKALEAVETGTDNLIFRGYVHELIGTVKKGQPLEKELSSGRYKHFPLIVAKMVGVGEKTGKLDETLLYLGDFFADEVDSTAKNLPTVLEPVLLVVIAGIVLFLALAIIGPIYDLTGSVRQ